MIKYGTAGGRCQTDQLVPVIHNFSIKLDCQRIFCFVFVFEKKEEEGMACPAVSCHFILKHCELRGFFTLV